MLNQSHRATTPNLWSHAWKQARTWWSRTGRGRRRARRALPSLERLEERLLLAATVTDLTSPLLTPTILVNGLLGSGVTASNIVYTGDNRGAGVFTDFQEPGFDQGIGADSGVILATGRVTDAIGPNLSDSMTTSFNTPGDPQLNAIVAPLTTNDAAILEFDFVPAGNTVTFQYVFASDEYTEFQNTSFTDLFAFFVENVNVALVPGMTTPVSINTVNTVFNNQFFRNNDPSFGTPTPFTIAYDGFTSIFTATANVTPGVSHHMKFAIADTLDTAFDSAVFLISGSFSSSALAGTVFNDLNGNGTQDAGEGGLANWTIFADQNNNGVLDSGTRTFQAPKPILDQQTTVAAIDVQGFNGTLTDVNVTLNITHTNDADLSVTLISPSGRRVKLFNNVGGTGDNFGTTLDDQAATSITSGSAPFTGTFRPEELLSAFNGENPNGVWLLEITDGTTGNEGILNNWSLTLNSAQSGVVDFKSKETPRFLRDSRTTDANIWVSGFTGDVTNITVNLDITHTYDADLDVFLISPSGRQVELFSDVGGSLDNFTNTTLDDLAAVSINSPTASAPFTGTFRPEGFLSGFNTVSPNGMWTLRITDDRSVDEGFLNNWSLTITTSENFTTTDNNGDFNLKVPNAGTYFITEVPQTGWVQTRPGGSGSIQQFVDQNQTVTGLLFGNRASNAIAPALFLPSGAATYTENGQSVVIDPQGRTEDATSGNFNGGTLVVSIPTNASVNDRLEIRNQGTGTGQISLNGPVISFSGPQGTVVIGNYTGGNGTTPLSITLNGQATPSITTALMRDITFRTVGESPTTAPRSVLFTLTDAPGGSTATLATTVNVVAVNDAPVNSLPTPLTIAKNTAVTIGGATPLSISDVDALDTDLVQVRLTAPDGTLTLSTTNGLTFTFNDANGTGVGDGTADPTMTFRGTRTSVNAAMNNLVFTPNFGFTGQTTINLVTNDLGTSGAGGAQTDSDSLSVNVINSAPTLTSISTLTGAAEDTDYVITYAALSAAANASDANGDTTMFRVDSVGTGSTLRKNGFPVIPGLTTLGVGESLVWRGPQDANGILAAFAVRAFDGTDVSSPPIAVRIDVAPQPDAPTLSQIAKFTGAINNIPFDITYSQLAAAANEGDVDGDVVSFRVESVSPGSTLTQSGVPVVPGTTRLGPGDTWTWTSELGASGDTAAFAIVAIDPGGLTSGTPITVIVNVIPNQAPTMTTVGTLTGGLRNIAFPVSHVLLSGVADESDADNDPIRFRVESVTQGTLRDNNGNLVIPGVTNLGATADPSKNQVSGLVWTPPAGLQGAAVPAFTITAFDGYRSSVTPLPVNIELVNVAPTMTFIPTFSGGLEDTPFSISYATLRSAANETDVNNDPIGFRIGQVGTGNLTINGLPVTAGATVINPADTITWSPPANQSGLFPAFSVRAFDGDLLSASEVPVNISVVAVPDAPTLTTVNTLSLGFESLPFDFAYDLVKSNSDAVDPDTGETVYFRVESILTGTLKKNGQTVVAGSTLLGPGEKLVWTPPVGTTGVVPAFTVRATDGTLNKVLTVTNTTMLRDGDKIAITVGGNTVTFELENTAVANGVTPGNTAINFNSGETTGSVASSIQSAINASILEVTKPAPLTGSKVTVEGTVFNPEITTTLSNAGAITLSNGTAPQRAFSATNVTVSVQVASLQAKEFLRAYNRPLDYHFFTTSRLEYDNAVAHGYEPEAADPTVGRTSFAVPTVEVQGTSLIHRLRNPFTGRHYYTSNTSEKNFLAQLGWIYEKDEGRAFTSQLPNTVEIYKLYNRSTGVHIYVDSAATRLAILNLSPSWEGNHTSLGFGFRTDTSGNAVLAPPTAPARSAPSRGSVSYELAIGTKLAPAKQDNGGQIPEAWFDSSAMSNLAVARIGSEGVRIPQGGDQSYRDGSARPVQSLSGKKPAKLDFNQLAPDSAMDTDQFWESLSESNSDLSAILGGF
jgi:subtilisin-like proprotein convertase family protein